MQYPLCLNCLLTTKDWLLLQAVAGVIADNSYTTAFMVLASVAFVPFALTWLLAIPLTTGGAIGER